MLTYPKTRAVLRRMCVTLAPREIEALVQAAVEDERDAYYALLVKGTEALDSLDSAPDYKLPEGVQIAHDPGPEPETEQEP